MKVDTKKAEMKDRICGADWQRWQICKVMVKASYQTEVGDAEKKKGGKKKRVE